MDLPRSRAEKVHSSEQNLALTGVETSISVLSDISRIGEIECWRDKCHEDTRFSQFWLVGGVGLRKDLRLPVVNSSFVSIVSGMISWLASFEVRRAPAQSRNPELLIEFSKLATDSSDV